MTNRPKPHPDHVRHHRRVIGKLEGNPSLVRAAVVAVLGLLATLGVKGASDVSDETVTALAVAIPAVALAVGWLIRQVVVPAVKVVSRVTTTGDVVAGEASGLPAGERLATVRDPEVLGATVLPVPINPDRLP